MTVRLWHLLPWSSKFTLLAGLVSILHWQLPGDDPPTLVAVYVCVAVSGLAGFREVLATGGQMPRIPGLSQSGRLILRTIESLSMVIALLIILRLA